MELAAGIAVKALLTSTFESTLMCFVDGATRALYQKEVGLISHLYFLAETAVLRTVTLQPSRDKGFFRKSFRYF